MRMRRLRRGLLRLHAAGGARTRPAERSDRARRSEAERIGSDPLLVEALRAAARGRPDPLAALPPQETARCAGSARCWPWPATRSRDGRERRGGALAGLAGLRARAAVERGQRARRPGRRGGRPRPRRRAGAVRRAPPGTPTGCPAPTSPGFTEYLAEPAAAGRLAGAPRARRARRSRCSPRTPRAAASGTWSRCPASRRAPGPTCGCAAACWATSGWSTWSPGSPSRRRGVAGRRRCWPRSAGCSTWPAPAPGTRCWSAPCEAEDEHPSRFLDEPRPRCRDEPTRVPGPARPPGARPGARWCSPSWSASCAAPVTDPAGTAQRRAAAQRAAVQLARLAEAGVPGAHPDDWYGLAAVSSDAPLRAPGEVVPVSPSDVEKIVRCPLRWVLETPRRRRVGRAGRGHRVAGARAGAGRRGRGAGGAELEGALARRGPARRRARLVRPPRARPGARHAGRVSTAGCAPAGPRACGWWPWSSRCSSTCRTVAAGRGGSRLRGRVDRLEVDAEGRPVVIDVKTGKAAVSAGPRRSTRSWRSTSSRRRSARSASCSPGPGRPPPDPAAPGWCTSRAATAAVKEPAQPPLDADGVEHWREAVAAAPGPPRGRSSSGPEHDCARCPVRTSCPVRATGR